MPKCKHSGRCGGCKFLDEDIDMQLNAKTGEIEELFSFLELDVSPCYGEYYPLMYRNKIHLAFGELKGKTLIGFFEEGSTKIQDVDSCFLFGDWVEKLIKILKEYVSRFKIRPFNKMGVGILRYAHARCIDNKLQLTLVVTTDNFAGREWLLHKLQQSFTEVSFYLNINRRGDHAVFDKIFKFVGGAKFLNFSVCGVKVSLSPASFLQVNLSVAEKMYKKALELLDIRNNTTVVDLYSGIGITSILFGKTANRVISIEEVGVAVDNARFMAKLNDAKNITLKCDKCEKAISSIEKADDMVVFVDPARNGMEKRVIDALVELNPRKIVYMSCNPDTCARDVKMLIDSGQYTATHLLPYNLFPYTKHIELLCCLQRKH